MKRWRRKPLQHPTTLSTTGSGRTGRIWRRSSEALLTNITVVQETNYELQIKWASFAWAIMEYGGKYECAMCIVARSVLLHWLYVQWFFKLNPYAMTRRRTIRPELEEATEGWYEPRDDTETVAVIDYRILKRYIEMLCITYHEVKMYCVSFILPIISHFKQ